MTSPARAVLCSSLHSSGAKDALALGGFSFLRGIEIAHGSDMRKRVEAAA